MDVFEKLNYVVQSLYEKNNELKTKDYFMTEDIFEAADFLADDEIEVDEARRHIEAAIDKKRRNNFKKYSNPEVVVRELDDALIKFFIDKANEKVKKENDKIKAEKSKLKSTIKKLKEVKSELEKDKVDIEKVSKLINESDLENFVKNELEEQIEKYSKEKNSKYEQDKILRDEKRKLEELKEKQEKEIILKEEQKEQKLFDIKNYEFIKDIVTSYENIFPNILFQMPIEDNFDIKDLTQIVSFRFNEIDDDLFSLSFITLLSKIDRAVSRENILVYSNILNELCKKYELLNNVIDSSNELQEFYSSFKVDEEDNKILLWVQNTISQAKTNQKYTELEVQNILNNIHETLHKLKTKKTNKQINNSSELNIKSFILFDYNQNEDKVKTPYVLFDLDESNNKTLIDNSLDRSKITINGYYDFNDLINDIIINGNPKITIDNTDKLEKFVRPVYYANNAYEMVNSSMKNSTGMYRIRPRIKSFVRFIDEKIIFIPNTKKFEQIVELLESKIKNVNIDRSSPFNIYINYVDAFKLDDFDAYKTAINRQKKSQLREILKKDNFEKSDLEELSDIIDITLDAYQELKKINDNFEFQTIDKLTSGNTLKQ